MKKFVTTMLVGLVTLNVLAQTAPGHPGIVVGIVVDQMRTDYIEYLQEYFGKDGFRKLMTEGLYLRDVDFKVNNLDAANATAMLYTGAYPSRTGVPSAYKYDRQADRLKPALTQSGIVGALNNDSYSPEQLRLSTISDELSVAGDGKGRIYAFSANPQQSVIMAGHAGTAAYWINNTTGNWGTTKWYGNNLSAVSSRNHSMSVGSRIDTMQWKPTLEVSRLPGWTAKKTQPIFRHTFNRNEKDVFIRFAASPMANREITDMAIECLKGLNTSVSSGAVDMLNIGYTLAPYKYVKSGDGRAELADSYIRLDKELERLFKAIDRYVGADNAVIWLSSTGYYDEAVLEDKKYRFPSGEFSMKRAQSLLNSYLSARHGNAGYVTGFKEGQLYFNHRLIEERGLNAKQLMEDAKAFLVKMSGVDEAYSLIDILSPGSEEERRMRMAVDPDEAGDIIVTFTPGWSVIDDLTYPSVTKQIRESAVITPAFIMAPGLKPKTISESIDATALAPTVAGILRIRSPNGSGTKPVLF